MLLEQRAPSHGVVKLVGRADRVWLHLTRLHSPRAERLVLTWSISGDFRDVRVVSLDALAREKSNFCRLNCCTARRNPMEVNRWIWKLLSFSSRWHASCLVSLGSLSPRSKELSRWHHRTRMLSVKAVVAYHTSSVLSVNFDTPILTGQYVIFFISEASKHVRAQPSHCACQVTATAFTRQFVEDTSAISANSASLLVSLFWLAISVGRLIALRDQQSLTLNRLLRHLMFTSVSGSIVVFVLLTSYSVDSIQWTTIITYGLFNGPTLGYCYDLSTRVSPNPARSTAVAMFGLTAGVSIVPILTAGLWEVTGLAAFLPIFLILSHIIPCFLLADVQKLHETGVGLQRRRSVREDSFSLTSVTPTFGPPSCGTTWSRANSALANEEEQHSSFEDEVQREMEIPTPREVADEGSPGGH